MKVVLTKHALLRFKQRVCELPKKLTRQVVEELLAKSRDYHGKRNYVNRRWWLHEQTGVLFLVNLSKRNTLLVVTVMRLTNCQKKRRAR